ncbi:MAG: hypothetical protein K2X71_06655, partial [Methylobacterium sp.]|nr:hypothetical protein [Methylobacterium sp.]
AALLRRLARAARRGDARAFRSHLAAADPALAAHWAGDPGTAPGLAALDRALFGEGTTPLPDLRRLARTLARSTPAPQAAAPDPLAALDGAAR